MKTKAFYQKGVRHFLAVKCPSSSNNRKELHSFSKYRCLLQMPANNKNKIALQRNFTLSQISSDIQFLTDFSFLISYSFIIAI